MRRLGGGLVGVMWRGERKGGDVPTKPVKAGRKDLGVAGIVVCRCVAGEKLWL